MCELLINFIIFPKTNVFFLLPMSSRLHWYHSLSKRMVIDHLRPTFMTRVDHVRVCVINPISSQLFSYLARTIFLIPSIRGVGAKLSMTFCVHSPSITKLYHFWFSNFLSRAIQLLKTAPLKSPYSIYLFYVLEWIIGPFCEIWWEVENFAVMRDNSQRTFFIFFSLRRRRIDGERRGWMAIPQDPLTFGFKQ